MKFNEQKIKTIDRRLKMPVQDDRQQVEGVIQLKENER